MSKACIFLMEGARVVSSIGGEEDITHASTSGEL